MTQLDGDPLGDWQHDMDTGREIRPEELVINVALTGCVHSKAQNQALPVTPEEIAADARRCADLGASIFHLHARDEHGNPTMAYNRIQEVVDAVRQQVPGAIVCVSCSGRHADEFVHRSEGLLVKPRPEMASLTMGSYNSFGSTITNRPSTIRALAKTMNERGIMPELECFEVGHVAYAHYLVMKQELQPPFWFNIFFGNLGTLPAVPGIMNHVVQFLPAGALWAASGIGDYQYMVHLWALVHGGQVRVGLEDSLWMDPDHEAPATNPILVEHVVEVARDCGRYPTSIERTREILGMEGI